MEQVTNRLKKGGGAVVTGLVEKESDNTEQALFEGDPEKFTTLEASTWQLDILDYSRQDAIAGYALVAVDVATREVYGELMADKSAIEARDAFARMLKDDGETEQSSLDPGVPAMVDTDHDRAFGGAFRLYLEAKSITHRLKTDARYSHNNLAMVDGVMGKIRSFIRKRLTEEAVPGQDNTSDWPEYFEEAVEAQNNKRYGVLSNMKPEELYNEKSKPKNEAAEHTIFKIQKDMVAGFAKNKQKQDNLKSEIDRTQTFRVPIDIGYQPTRFGRRITQSIFSGQTHRVDVAATDAQGNPSRVVSQRDGRSYPLSTIDIVEAGSADVVIPDRAQRNPRRQREVMEAHLEDYRDAGLEFLANAVAGQGNYEGVQLATNAEEATVEDFGENIIAMVPPGTYEGFRLHLSRIGIRAGQPNRLYVKFIEFWRAYFGLRNRKKIVFLREERFEDEDPDDDFPAPAIPDDPGDLGTRSTAEGTGGAASGSTDPPRGGTSGTSGPATRRGNEAFVDRMKRLGLSFLYKESTDELEGFRQQLVDSGRPEARIQSYMSKLAAVTGGRRYHNSPMPYVDEFLAHFQALHPGLSGVDLILAIDSDELENFWRDFQARAKQRTGTSSGQVRGPGIDSMGDLITAVREFRESRGIARGAGGARGKPKAKGAAAPARGRGGGRRGRPPGRGR
jgi:hypothetical protein